MLVFNFPDNKAIFKNTIKNFTTKKSGKVNFQPIDILNPTDNIINIDGTEYVFTYLNKGGKNKGGNSIILKLFLSQEFDFENIEYDEPDLIIKISRSKKTNNPLFESSSEKRFIKEIRALEDCKSKNFENIIDIEKHGTCKIYNTYKKEFDEHLFYTMEYANDDLKTYIEKNIEITIQEKISLCLSLSKGLDELSSLGYYHRDIKPDNIFIADNTWKIGDLGLVSERNFEDIDFTNEFIGPRGWHSPEAMNKYLCEGKSFTFSHDCKLDHQSDIFQLGKVFWYILQNNAPTGVFKQNDTYIKNNDIYPIIRTMLNYSKKRRYSDINEVINLLKPIEKRLQTS